MIRTVAFISALISASVSAADSTVKGTVRKDGAYVPPHQRTAPNRTRTDNYSSKPNINPYTGKAGRVDPYAPKQPRTRR